MSVIWHDTECGSYAADLPLWEEMADAADRVLDLGCGTGRVGLHLAKRGHSVTGLDLDEELVTAFNERASGRARAVVGDARDFSLADDFGLVLAPMQLLQLLPGAGDRDRCLRCIAGHLKPGGLAAFAIVDSVPAAVDAPPPMPDGREIDGWVYSSLPLDAAVRDGEIVVRRLRQTVSPGGELDEEIDEIRLGLLSADTVEREGSQAGLAPAGRCEIRPTEDHVGSTVVLLEKEA